MYERGVDFRLGSNTDRRPSPALWDKIPFTRIQSGDLDGIAIFDDFSELPLVAIGAEAAQGRYKRFGDTGNTITKVISVNSVLTPGGALQFVLDTDNDEVTLCHSFPSFLLTGLTTNSGPAAFEFCYAQNSIAANQAAGFIGLANVAAIALSTTVPFNDADAIDASMYGIGFRILENGLGVVDTVYTDGATSFTNIGDDEGGTLVANTFVKYGMTYDPSNVNECITFWKDNQKLTTKMTRAALTALTNLDVNGLGFMASFCAAASGTSFKSYLKWIKMAQLAPSTQP